MTLISVAVLRELMDRVPDHATVVRFVMVPTQGYLAMDVTKEPLHTLEDARWDRVYERQKRDWVRGDTMSRRTETVHVRGGQV